MPGVDEPWHTLALVDSGAEVSAAAMGAAPAAWREAIKHSSGGGHIIMGESHRAIRARQQVTIRTESPKSPLMSRPVIDTTTELLFIETGELDERADVIIGIDIIDANGVDRIGGATPAIRCRDTSIPLVSGRGRQPKRGSRRERERRTHDQARAAAMRDGRNEAIAASSNTEGAKPEPLLAALSACKPGDAPDGVAIYAAANGVTIAPGRGVAVPLTHAAGPRLAGTILLDPIHDDGQDGPGTRMPSLADADGCIRMHVWNYSSQAISLRKGDTMAAAEEVHAIDSRDAPRLAATNEALRVGGRDGPDEGPPDRTVDRPWHERAADMTFCAELSEEQRHELMAVISEYDDVISDVLKKSTLAKAVIDTGDNAPIFVRAYRQTLYDRRQLQEYADKLVEKGCAEECDPQPWNSPLLTVAKPDGGTRVVADFRGLNSRTINVPQYPLPDVQATLAELAGLEYHSCTDLLSGYWGFELEAGSRNCTAFKVGRRTYRWTVLPMGTVGASGFFQAAQDRNFRTAPATRPFVDDALTSSATWSQHVSDVRAMLECCRKSNVAIKPRKCYWGFREIKYVGYLVSGSGVRVDPEYTAALRARSAPTTLKQGQRLLGALNWTRRFGIGYANTIAPIQEIVKPGKRWARQRKDEAGVAIPFSGEWKERHQRALDAWLQELEHCVRLAHPSPSGQYTLYTDYSKHATGAVLTQQQDGRDVLIAVDSAINSERESRYSPVEGEALAIINGLRKMRFYLHGARGWRLVSDQKALQWVTSNPSKSPRLANWKTTLADFDYKPHYEAGATIAFVDWLSRPGGSGEWRPHEGRDALGRPAETIYAEQRVARQLAAIRHIPARAAVWNHLSISKLREAQAEDSFWAAAADYIDAGGDEQDKAAALEQLGGRERRVLSKVGPSLEFNADGVICRRSDSPVGGLKVGIPGSMRGAVLSLAHDDSHASADASADRAARYCWWDRMHRDFRDYVASCDACLSRRGSTRGKLHRDMGEVTPAQNCGDHWHFDAMGPITLHGHDQPFYVLAAMDSLAGFAIGEVLLPKRKAGRRGDPQWGRVDSQDTLEFTMSRVIWPHGWPLRMSVDGGSEFKGVFEEAMKQNGISPHRTAALGSHDGLKVERLWRIIWDRLAFCRPKGIPDVAPMVQMAFSEYNMTPSHLHSTHRPGQRASNRLTTTPFECMFGRPYRCKLDSLWRPYGSCMKDAFDAFSTAQERAREAMRQAHAARRTRARKATNVRFSVGDEVYVEHAPRPEHAGTSAKMLFHFEPATVIEIVRDPTQYKVRSHITGAEVTRHLKDLRARPSRPAQAARLGGGPFLRGTTQSLVGESHAPPAPPEWQGSGGPRADLEVGMVVAVMREPDIEEGHEWLIPPAPRAIVGRIMRVQGRTATIRPMRAASGMQFGHSPAETGNVRGDDFAVALARSRFIGAVESAAGTCSAGSWGVYAGPNLDGGKVMERIVARDLTDTGSGCMGTVYRVRQLGIGAAFDVFCDEAALRHYWPDQAEEELSKFERNQPQPMHQ